MIPRTARQWVRRGRRSLNGAWPSLYRALAGSREARGLVREDAKESDVPGLKKADYLDEEAFWSQVEAAKELARVAVARMRAGDVVTCADGQPLETRAIDVIGVHRGDVFDLTTWSGTAERHTIRAADGAVVWDA